MSQRAFEVAVGFEGARRVVAGTRIALAGPVAYRNGKLPLWALELASQKATNDVVPHTGDAVLFGKKVARFWDHAFVFRNGATALACVAQLAISLPSLAESSRENGVHGLIGSEKGRQGVIALAAGGYTTAGIAYHAMKGRSELGGVGRAALRAPALGSWAMGGPALAGWALLVANKMGAFDALNREPAG